MAAVIGQERAASRPPMAVARSAGRGRGLLRAAVLLAAAAAVQACVPNPAVDLVTQYCLPYYSWIPPPPTVLGAAEQFACTPIGTPNVDIAVTSGQTLAYPLTGIAKDAAPFVTTPAVTVLWNTGLSKYIVYWGSSSTEDVQGYQCLDISRAGTSTTPFAALVTTCEQRVCRKLCTCPTWRISAGMYDLSQAGADVTNRHWRWGSPSPTLLRVGEQVL